jgi:hypothetical protein
MRLAFATAILAQTLTASSSSETHKTAPLLAQAEQRQLVQQLLLSKNNDPASEPRIKHFKRNKDKGSGFFSSLQAKKNAVLKNKGSEEDAPCDPTSSDPDVGILSCGMGKYCSESTDYDLGGVCVDSSMMEESVHRDLQDDYREVYFKFCTPGSALLGLMGPNFDSTNRTRDSTTSADIPMNG